MHGKRIGRWAAIALAAASCVTAPAIARADGYSFAQGDEGAVAAGAVVATSSDPGSAWYNPAGLALNRRTKFNVSASLYGIRFDHVDDGFAFQIDGQQLEAQDLSSTQVLILSPSVVMATALKPGLTLGLGVFVTQYGYGWLSADFSAQVEDPYYGQLDILSYYDSDQNRVRYHVGPTLGWSVTPKLRLGFHLYGIYESYVNNQVVTMSVTGGYQAGVTEQIKDSPIRWGIQPGVGLQWEILPQLRFGLMVRGPAMVIAETPEQRIATTVSFVAPPNVLYPGDPGAAVSTSSVSPVRPNGGFGLLQPLQITGGFAWYYDHGWIDVEFEYRMGLENKELLVDLSPTWNVRAGMIHEVSRGLSIGGGVFTNRTDQPNGGLNSPVSLYGFTVGLQTRTYLRGSPDPVEPPAEGAPAPREKPLVFGTTLSLRFAGGSGSVRSLAVGYDTRCLAAVGVNFCALPGQTTKSSTYAVSLYLGSSLEF